MRRFFHVRRGQVTILDQDGLELADLEAATEEAVRRARQIGASQAVKGVAASIGMIVVDDEFYRTVLELVV
jgi:hypothetical protein